MKDGFGTLVCGAILGGLAGWMLGSIMEFNNTMELRAEAVKHGAAEWVIKDQATGTTEFRWKPRPGGA